MNKELKKALLENDLKHLNQRQEGVHNQLMRLNGLKSSLKERIGKKQIELNNL